MADKSAQLILDAFSRAILQPDGMPLHGNKATAGMFPANATGRQVAQQCKNDGLIHQVGTETRGKNTVEKWALTEKGRGQFLTATSPRDVLQEFVRALEGRQTHMRELVASARQSQLGLEALRLVAQQILEQIQGQLPMTTTTTAVGKSSNGWHEAALNQLGRWQAAGTSEDCPLPALYRQVAQTFPGLTVGQFHDGLRTLHERNQIYLHPWTGPLYDLPEPLYALLVGHEVLYYASLRPAQNRSATAGKETQQVYSYEYAGTEL